MSWRLRNRLAAAREAEAAASEPAEPAERPAAEPEPERDARGRFAKGKGRG
jgi:hypothetical protein